MGSYKEIQLQVAQRAAPGLKEPQVEAAGGVLLNSEEEVEEGVAKKGELFLINVKCGIHGVDAHRRFQ